MNGSKWNGWYCSCIGPSHIANGMPNQDFAQLCISKKITVGVVCDGLGSKKYSHIGSKALAKSLISAASIFDFSKNLNLFEPVLKSLWDVNIYPYSNEDCKTTLLFCIIKNSKIYIGRVGDGAIVVLGKKDVVVLEKDEFANITNSFGGTTKIDWQVFQEQDIEAVIIFTDGISDDIASSQMINFAKSFVSEYKNMKQNKKKRAIYRWLKNWPVKGHSDDKSILALQRQTSEKNR